MSQNSNTSVYLQYQLCLCDNLSTLQDEAVWAITQLMPSEYHSEWVRPGGEWDGVLAQLSASLRAAADIAWRMPMYLQQVLDATLDRQMAQVGMLRVEVERVCGHYEDHWLQGDPDGAADKAMLEASLCHHCERDDAERRAEDATEQMTAAHEASTNMTELHESLVEPAEGPDGEAEDWCDMDIPIDEMVLPKGW